VTHRRPYDWQLDEDVELLKQFLGRVRRFFAALRDVGLHVGVGCPPECVTCGTPWPCEHAQARQ
jgi:hypothetical protein